MPKIYAKLLMNKNNITTKKCIALLASTTDAASMNVYSQLTTSWKKTTLEFEENPIFVKEFPHYFAYIFLTQQRSVYAENIDRQIENTLSTPIEALIFITKHDSKSGRPSFSVHTQGNWDKNELGGNPKEIATCPVILKHTLYQSLLKTNNLADFEIVNEATHHGPSISVPSMFIEIGSTQSEWERKDTANVIFQALNLGLTIYNGENDTNFGDMPTIIVLGGTHTCTNSERLILENKVMLSHACPTYAVDTLTSQLITQAIEKSTTTKTQNKSPFIVIDWKSMSAPQRERVMKQLSEINKPYVRLSALKDELDRKNQA